MPATQVQIVNRALLQMGARATVTAIDGTDTSTAGLAAQILFTPKFEELARSAHWNCLRQETTLTVFAAADGTPENPNGTTLPLPPPPFRYSYLLPSDCLDVRFLLPPIQPGGSGSSATSYNNAAVSMMPGVGQVPFVVGYTANSGGTPIQTIMTDLANAWIVYTINQPNPIIWDSQFQAAMVASLVVGFIPALSLNLPLLQAAKAEAERLVMQARVTDGNEGVTVMDHVPDWMRARGHGRHEWGNGLLGQGNSGAIGGRNFSGDFSSDFS